MAGPLGLLRVALSGWLVAASPQPPANTNVFISEYGEGTKARWIELYNAGNVTANLGEYALAKTSNGADVLGRHDFWYQINADNLMLKPDGTFIIVWAGSHRALFLKHDWIATLSSGNDGLALAYGTEDDHTIIDRIGDFGENPGFGWDVCGLLNGTRNKMLVRKARFCRGNADWNSSAGKNLEDCEWIVYEQNVDDHRFLGSHSCDEEADTAASSGSLMAALAIGVAHLLSPIC